MKIRYILHDLSANAYYLGIGTEGPIFADENYDYVLQNDTYQFDQRRDAEQETANLFDEWPDAMKNRVVTIVEIYATD